MWNLYQQLIALMTRMRAEEGQSMVEYGILIAVIAVVVVTAATLLGTNVSSVFNSIAGKI